MSIRIHRTFEWKIPKQTGEIRYGGTPPRTTLHSTDTLQFLDGEEWVDVPIVEAERPERPEQLDVYGRRIP